MTGGQAARGRRQITRASRRLVVVAGIDAAQHATRRLERFARLCRERLVARDPAGVRVALDHVFDAAEQIEAGLAAEFPPCDPGQPDDAPGPANDRRPR